MPAIGFVTRNDEKNTYTGHIRTLSVKAPIEITPNRDKTNDRQPDYRVFSEGTEVGAAWVKTGQQSGEEYVSLSLAAPEFGPRKLYANLGPAAGQDDEDVFALIWNPAD